MAESDLGELARKYLEQADLLSRKEVHKIARKPHESKTERDLVRSKERRAKNKARAVKRSHRTTKKKHGRSVNG